MEAHSGNPLYLSVSFIASLQQDSGLIFLICFLLFLSFIIAGSEVAFFSLSYKDIQVLKTKRHIPLQRIVKLLEDPKKLLTSMLIANSFINICIILIANILIDHLFVFDQIAIPGFEFIVKIVAVTLLLLFFGEILPKVMATQNNIRFAQDFGFIIQVVYFIFSGLSGLMVKYTNLMEKKLAQKGSGASYSMEELDHAIELTSSAHHQENEKNILKGIVKFGNITVKQIMKTRLDVHGIEEEVDFPTLLKNINEFSYSRFPIFKDDLDTIVGMIHTKDIIPHLKEPDQFKWQTLIRPAFFVHEQKMIEDLLQEFQLKRIHFGIVVDEFGGTSGIITLEDILEEIVGEIKDEFDEEETTGQQVDDHTYIFEGKTLLTDLCRALSIPTDTFDEVKGESDSLAGLLLERVGALPAKEQIIVFGDFEFKVLELEQNRIQRVQVSIHYPS